MPKKTEITFDKTFYGEKYHVFGYAISRKNANNIAKGFKTLGFKTRIVSFTGHSMLEPQKEQKEYAVYVSNKKYDRVKK